MSSQLDVKSTEDRQEGCFVLQMLWNVAHYLIPWDLECRRVEKNILKNLINEHLSFLLLETTDP